MPNFDSELAYFRIRLGQRFADRVSSGQPIPAEAIREEVENGPFKNLSHADRESAIRELEHNFTTTQKRGSAVKSDYRPWLNSRRSAIDFYYWNRLKRYYLEGNVLPPQVVATLDAVTDEILDYSGDPADLLPWSRRGMVMGHVQSGKTTNYSSLICKASDAGYKVIILLAGITNSLRTQTQERLDETFIGKKSVFHAIANEALPIQMYAGNRRFPAYGTSRDKDFTKDAAGVFFSLAAHNEPIIFVTKKNKATLERLRDWIREQSHGQKMAYPLLLIDDEADNASINTEKDPQKVTVINKVIREILGVFERSSYIGYTATPFANIFIDPDNELSMLDDDLFPRHFIKALDPPSNYVGATRVFAEEGDLRKLMVRTINDYKGILDLAHKREHAVPALPPSLNEAIRIFCLTRAIRVVRGQGARHCSMMINVSRFNDVQEKVLGHVYNYLNALKNSIGVNAGLSHGEVADRNILDMQSDFQKEFGNTGFKFFEEILPALPEAVENIKPLTVNMKGGVLDYSKHKLTGLHVIAIGGLALSRGLTLEDLTTSYILRNTAASDTLMQMARWFGYRSGFEDICRVYLPKTSLDHYIYVNEAIEELRTEVKRMELLKLTPEDFGLRVRQSPLAIRITAANKMRTASSLILAQDYSTRHVEGHALINDADVNLGNLAAIDKFVSSLGSKSTKFPKDSALIWTDVPWPSVMTLLKSFRFSEAHADLGHIMGGTSLLIDYISDRISTTLEEWDVAIPRISGTGSREIAGEFLALRSRDSGTLDPINVYRITGHKNRVADPKDAQLALEPELKVQGDREKKMEGGLRGDRAYCAQRKKPLLIIHLFQNMNPPEGFTLSNPIASLSFCFPTSHQIGIARTYQVNKVYARQLELYSDEVDDDEAILDAPSDD